LQIYPLEATQKNTLSFLSGDSKSMLLEVYEE